MKTYDEMAQSVFERRDTYISEQREKRKSIKKTVISLSYICLIAALGFTVSIFGVSSETKLPVNKNTESSSVTETSTQNAGTVNGPFMPAGETDTDTPTYREPVPMISSFPEAGVGCYIAPKNGEDVISIALNQAMENYGDSVIYQVALAFLKDEKILTKQSEVDLEKEQERLSDLGYIVALETFTDSDGSASLCLSLHAKADQIKNFKPSDEYGYMLWLYEEDDAKSGWLK